MTTFIFGHKNPDTDSIASAIALSYLKNKQGMNTKPMKLGELNKETEFVLNKFGVEEPELLLDVRPQVRDLKHESIDKVLPDESIEECKNILKNDETALLAIVDGEDKLVGVANLKDIAVKTLKRDMEEIDASVSNLLTILEGKLVDGSENGNIEGRVKLIARMDDFEDVDSKNVLITSSSRVAKKAAENRVRLIIFTNGKMPDEEAIKKIKEEETMLITTDMDIFSVARVIDRSNDISTVMNTEVIKFYEDDFLDDVREVMLESKRRSFPIVDKDNKLLGCIDRNHIINPGRKEVILVDHNEYGQSVNGLKEARVIEIVDHHKIGGIMTSNPISFRNMIVGSTCTIVYSMFKEANIDIPREIAGLLISGITSDTLILRSPTTTDKDREAVDELSKILDIDIKEYGMSMFKAGTSLEGYTIEEIFYRDFKEFTVDGHKIGIGQVFTLDIDEIMAKKQEYIDFIKGKQEEDGYYMAILAFTDIIEESSYLIYGAEKTNIVTEAFKIKNEQGALVPGLVSRKKQMVPNIMDAYNIYGKE
ncbi:MAG: putative manganese-dependent inorganic diphosphatase [Andreesenia angusta]|nr:putative manganese-dependent inorganic diphosphatase [Andreesenia angusta]